MQGCSHVSEMNSKDFAEIAQPHCWAVKLSHGSCMNSSAACREYLYAYHTDHVTILHVLTSWGAM
jgi:hypothetical protein